MSPDAPARRAHPASAGSTERRPPALDCAGCGTGLTPISLDRHPEWTASTDDGTERPQPPHAPCWLLRCDRCGAQSIWTDR